MNEGSIPEAVRKFIQEQIHSIEQLEVLLLMRGSPDRDWSAVEISHELRSDAGSISRRLKDLESRRLIRSAEATGMGYRYSPADPEISAILEALQAAYSERRYSVIDLIFSRPNDALTTFSNAFVFKRDKSDG